MTLQTSGPISLANIETEIGRAVGAPVAIGEAALRTLAAISSGPISMSDFYGKTNAGSPPPPPPAFAIQIMPGSINNGGNPVHSAGSGGTAAAGFVATPFGGNGTSSVSWSWSRLSSTGSASFLGAPTDFARSSTLQLTNSFAQHEVQTYSETWRIDGVENVTGATASSTCTIFFFVNDY